MVPAVACPTPSVANRSQATEVGLTLRTNLAGAAHDYPTTFRFHYLPRPHVLGTLPDTSATTGGNAILVQGSGFSEYLRPRRPCTEERDGTRKTDSEKESLGVCGVDTLVITLWAVGDTLR